MQRRGDEPKPKITTGQRATGETRLPPKDTRGPIQRLGDAKTSSCPRYRCLTSPSPRSHSRRSRQPRRPESRPLFPSRTCSRLVTAW